MKVRLCGDVYDGFYFEDVDSHISYGDVVDVPDDFLTRAKVVLSAYADVQNEIWERWGEAEYNRRDKERLVQSSCTWPERGEVP